MNTLRWLVLILLGLAIYAQTFGFGFVFDDNFYILDTSYIKSFDAISPIWAILPKTRLVGIYSFAWNYNIGQLDPRGYHIFNFLVHLLAAGLVWALAALLFKIAGGKSNKPLLQELPFFIALLFLVHPCQTQAVSYISQRFESMAAVFYLGSIYFYLRGRTASLRADKVFLFTCSVGFSLLGILTKETAVTIPLMILAVEFILFNRVPVKSKKSSPRQPYLLISILGVLFVLLLMKMVRTDFFNIYFHFSAPSESHQGDMITGGRYVLTQMRVFLTFLRLLIFPINQNVDYDYPLSTGILAPPLTLVGLCLIGFIIFLIFRLRKEWPLIAFGLAWILITFSINTAPRVNVIFEHKLYLISFGFFLAAVCALSTVIKDRKILFGILITLIAVLSLASYNRNQVWKSELTLWSDAARKSPHKARPYSSLGVAYGMQGDFVQALQNINKAITINPNYAQAYNNRGNTYSKLGNYTQAILDLNKAIAIKPDYTQAYTNLSEVYDKRATVSAQQGNFTQAMPDFNKAIEINPGHAEFYVNRGTCYAQQGDLAQALSDYGKVIAINPDYAEVYYNRAVTYYQLKKYDRAWKDVHRAEELGAAVNLKFISVLRRVSGIE